MAPTGTVIAPSQQDEALRYLSMHSGGLWSRREVLSSLPLKDRVEHALGLLVALGITVDDLAAEAAEDEPQLRAMREQGAR